MKLEKLKLEMTTWAKFSNFARCFQTRFDPFQLLIFIQLTFLTARIPVWSLLNIETNLSHGIEIYFQWPLVKWGHTKVSIYWPVLLPLTFQLWHFICDKSIVRWQCRIWVIMTHNFWVIMSHLMDSIWCSRNTGICFRLCISGESFPTFAFRRTNQIDAFRWE